jgi:hypothetical protein
MKNNLRTTEPENLNRISTRALFTRALFAALLITSTLATAQTPAATSAVPPMVNFRGTLVDGHSKPLSTVVGVTFSLYKDSEGGAPLWVETQNVQPDKSGHYKVMLGSSTSQGLPPALFASGEARWLGVHVQGQEEQARTLLLSVPYALKALDAETLGGKPASAFLTGSSANSNALSPVATVTGSGKKDFVPMWLTKTKLGDSILFQSTSGNVGIGTTTPGSTLDVNGAGNFAETLTAGAASITGNIGASGNITADGGITAVGVVTGVQGLFGNSGSDTNSAVAVNNGAGFSASAGINHDSGHLSYGVSGQSFSEFGVGVLGYGVNFSNTYNTLAGLEPFGVAGDAQDVSGVIPVGVWGTADAGAGVAGENNSTVEPAGVFVNFNTTGTSLAFEAEGKKGHCTIDISGDLSCTGTKGAVVQLPDNRAVQLYAMESPNNWFEDFGSGQLSAGSAVIKLDSIFAETVNSDVEYHVFLTPNGDSRGLYVAKKTAASFEVREQGGGTSTVGFDYRIVARRKGYENVRMADVTEMQKTIASSDHRMMTQRNSGNVKPPAVAQIQHKPALSPQKSNH